MRTAKSNPMDFKFELCIGLGTHHVKILPNEYQNTSLYEDPLKIWRPQQTLKGQWFTNRHKELPNPSQGRCLSPAILADANANKHKFGCGFVVSKRLRYLVFRFTPVNERIATIRIRAKFYNISFIMLTPWWKKKTMRLKTPSTLLLLLSSRTYMISARPLTPKSSSEILMSVFGPTAGEFNLHEITTSNGMRLIDFNAGRNMVVCNTKFQHLDIHKATWMSPDLSTSNQIDTVIDRKHVSNVHVRTFRDRNIDSYHYLVAAKFQLHISVSRSARSSTLRQPYVKKDTVCAT